VILQELARSAADKTHQVVHKFRQSPGLTQSEQSMPMIWHNNESAQINTSGLNRKPESGDDDFAPLHLKLLFSETGIL
jgi:hypothetical protein